MIRKHAWPYALPSLLFVPLLALCLWMQHVSVPGRDGQGPDVTYLGWVLLAGVLGLGLGITTLLAMFGKASRSRLRPHRLRVISYHAVLWLALVLVFAARPITDTAARWMAGQTPGAKVLDALYDGRDHDFYRLYAEARQQGVPMTAIDNDAIYSSLADYRLDILAFLRGQGASLVDKEAGKDIKSRVIEVLYARGDRPARATLDMVNWVLAQDAPSARSLAGSDDFSSVGFYESAYKDIDTPDTRELLRVLAAHGADIVGCPGTAIRPCPLLYFAGQGDTAVVSFLLAQGVDPDSNDGETPGATALSTAISAGQVGTIKVLLAHGAHIRQTQDQNDLIDACGLFVGEWADRMQSARQALHDAHLHITKDELHRYKGEVLDEQRPCIASFMLPAAPASEPSK